MPLSSEGVARGKSKTMETDHRITREPGRSRRLSLVLLALSFGAIVGGPVRAAQWEVSQTSTPLTGAARFAADLASENEVLNQIVLAERAVFVIRCSEGVLATYFSWPQVVRQDYAGILFGPPGVIAFLRLDDGKITTASFDLTSDQLGVGHLSTRGARKFLDSLQGHAKLVVRIQGQDAVFDLTDIEKVAAGAYSTCGLPGGAPYLAPVAAPASQEAPPATKGPATAALPTPAADEDIGVMGGPGEAAVASGLAPPGTRGVLIMTVQPGSIAAHGGLQGGDIIDVFDGKPLTTPVDLYAAIKAAPPGAPVPVHVFRFGRSLNLTLRL